MNNERFTYIKSDFITENTHLKSSPKNSVDAYNKLTCLAESNRRRNPFYKPFDYSFLKRSKRYNRLLKMFWAYKKQEGRKDLGYILDEVRV